MFRKPNLLCLLAVFAVLMSPQARAQLYGTNPFQNGGGDMGALYRFDVDTGAYMTGSGTQVTLNGLAITGINAATIDPSTGTAYAVLRVAGVTGRVLATLNLQTGAAVQIGNLGDKFSSISFRADGQLFGTTANGATVPKALFLIDKATAVPTMATPLGGNADGEVIAYNPNDTQFYHWSGNPTVVFDKILSVPPYTVTSIPIIGVTNGETYGAVWDPCRTTFIASNVQSKFNLWNPNGTVSAAYGAGPDYFRGLALIGNNTCDVDLGIVLQSDPQTPIAADPITLKVRVMNTGPARALAPTVTVILPASITTATTAGCVEDPIGIPTCTLQKLYQGDIGDFTIAGTWTGGTGIVTTTVTTISTEIAPADNTISLLLGDMLLQDSFE